MSKRFKGVFTVLLALTIACGIIAVPVSRADAAENYTVSPSERFQTVDGWGTSLIWWAGQVGGYDWAGDDGRAVREQIMELIYGDDGLEYNIARYNVPGGENPDCSFGAGHMQQGREMEGYKTTETAEYNWDADANQRWVLDWIESNVDDYVVEAFSNSPPWWMLQSECASGAPNGLANIKEDYLDDFAVYFVDVIEHMIEVDGVKIDYINPFNESTSTWWKAGGSQEGCYFTNDERYLIMAYVADELDKRGLDVKLTFDDSTGADKAYKAYESLIAYCKTNENPELLEKITKLNYHLYEDGNDLLKQASIRRLGNREVLRTASNADKVWMSEMGYNMADGLEAVPMATAFEHSKHIRETLTTANANAYILWQVVEELSSQLGNDTNYGPIKVSYNSKADVPALGNEGYTLGSYKLDKQYYVLGQYSKYIKAGYSMIASSDGTGVAAVSPDGKQVVIVHENSGDTAQQLNYTLDGYVIASGKAVVTDKTSNWKETSMAASGEAFSYTVTPSSVTTFVLNVEQYKGTGYFIDETRAKFVGDKADTQAPYTQMPTVAELLDPSQPFDVFVLSGEWGGISGDTNMQSLVGNTRYANTGNKAMIKFKGTGIDVRAKMKNDSTESITFAIDNDAGTTVSLKKGSTVHGSAFRVNDLEYGDHVLTITINSGWFNLDGAFVITEADKTYSTPTLQGATIVDGDLYVSFSGEQAAYAVEYRPTGAAWETVEVTEQGTGEGDVKSYFVKAAQELPAGTYEVRVKSGDTYSRTQSLINTAKDPKLLYYVDAGAVDVGAYTAYERAGAFNTFKDGMFGADPVSGKQWGRTSTGNAAYAMGTIGSPYRSIGDCLSADGSANGTIAYKFEVGTTGTFDLTLTLFNSWSDRRAKISINGVETGTFTGLEKENVLVMLTDIAPDAQGFIEVVLTKADNETDNNKPCLGTILVAAHGDKTAAYASAVPFEEMEYTLPTGSTSDKVQCLRIPPVTNRYATPFDFTSKAYVAYTDGTATEAASVRYDDIYVTNPVPNVKAGTVSGAADGLHFLNDLYMEQEAQTYYAINCGTDGTVNDLPQGTLHQGVTDQQSTGEDVWGWMDNTSAEWRNETYKNATRYTGNKYLRYRLTDLTPGSTVMVTLGSNALWGWGKRSFDVYVNTTGDYPADNTAPTDSTPGYIGTVNLTSDGQVIEVNGIITVPESGTIYVIAFNRADRQNPQIAYIEVIDEAAPTPAAPKTDRTEATAEDTVLVSGLTVGDLLILSNENGKYIGGITATATTMAVDLNDYPLEGSQAVVFTARHYGSLSDSESTLVALPTVLVTGFREGWSDRNVLRIAPSTGVNVQKIVVVSPTGKRANVTNNEYFHYITKENGTFTVELTTKSNKTYTSTFDIANVDLITIHAVKSTETWTTQDVTVQISLDYAPGAIREFYINDEAQGIRDSYTVTAQANATFELKAVSAGGNEYTYDLEVANIDKGALDYNVTPDYTFVGGFKADLTPVNVSGGTFTVTKGDKTYGGANGLMLVEAGEYTVTYTTGLNETDSFTVNLAYKAEDCKLMTVALDGDRLNVTADGATVKVYRGGQAVEAGENGYALTAGSYTVYAEKDGAYEAFFVNVAAASEAPKKGCGCGSVTGMGALGALAAALLLAAGTLAFGLRRKGGKKL